MNAVEIEEAVSNLAEAPFDPAAFPFAFLEAFGNKETTLKRLKSGNSNQSDLGGVLQRNNIHLKVCPEGEVTATLAALRQSAATARHKAKFILATDGQTLEAENLVEGDILACPYPDFHDHFGFFLPLAGITTVKQIRENAFDIKATGRLNRLYIELLKENSASHNAGVTVIIVGISNDSRKSKRLFAINDEGEVIVKDVGSINAYLVPGAIVIVHPQSKANDSRALMEWGNKPTDGGHLFMTVDERAELLAQSPHSEEFIKRFLGAQEFIRGEQRFCLWIEDHDREKAEAIPQIAARIKQVAKMRSDSKAAETRPAAAFPHRFRQIQSVAKERSLVVARVSSEQRSFLPVGLENKDTVVGDRNFALYDAPLWNMALIASRLHLIWIATVCGKLETRYRYSNTLGWNTFPVPTLTDQNKADLTRCAEDILLARESHFPATIADLYDPEAMPADLRDAHDRNDETLERIYVGRRFKNDTERLEKLFDLYTQMTAAQPAPKKSPPRKKKGPNPP